MRVWPTQRFMLLTHVKELIAQNVEALFEIWPNAPVGIYSAGLKSRDIAYPYYAYAGIQSAIKNPMDRLGIAILSLLIDGVTL